MSKKPSTTDCITVDQLILQLKRLSSLGHGNNIVIIQADGEGNGYSPYSECGEASYLPETNWNGNIVETVLTPFLIEHGYSKEDIYDGIDSIPCVVLAPRN